MKFPIELNNKGHNPYLKQKKKRKREPERIVTITHIVENYKNHYQKHLTASSSFSAIKARPPGLVVPFQDKYCTIIYTRTYEKVFKLKITVDCTTTKTNRFQMSHYSATNLFIRSV